MRIKGLKSVGVCLVLLIVLQNTVAAMSDYKNIYRIDYMDEIFRFDTGEFLDGFEFAEQDKNPYEFYMEVLKTFGVNLLTENAGKTYKSNAEFSDLYGACASIIADSKYAEDYKSGYFKGNVTMREALLLMEDMLGYEKLRERMSAESIAVDNNLLKNLRYQDERYITIGELAVMLWNTLNANGIEVSFVNNGLSYTKSGTKLMERQLDIYKISGFLNAADGRNIYKNSAPRNGIAEIDRTEYFIGESEAKDYLGKRVTAYVKCDEYENKTILYLQEEKGGENLTINLNDIYSVNDYIEYEALDGSEKRADIRKLEYILLNGDSIKDISVINDFENMDGTITLSKSERKGNYDTALINSYSYYVIYSVDTYENKINLKDGAKFKGKTYIEIPDNELVYCTLNGEKVDYSELIAGNTIRVVQNSEKTYTEIEASSDGVTGRIAEIDSTGRKARVGDIWYNISSTYKNLPDSKKINTGLFGSFYVSKDKYIAGFKDGSEASYAYLRSIILDEDTERVKVKIFTEGGKWESHELKKKITLDGTDGVEALNAFNMIKNNKGTDNLVRYKVNGLNEITYLDTIADEIKEADDKNRITFAYEGNVEQSWQGGKWFRTDIGYRLLDNAPVFQVPNNKEKTADYRVKTGVGLNADQQSIYIKLYSANELGLCSAAIMGETQDNLGNETTYWLYCESMSAIWDEENDESAYVLKGLRMQSGKTATTPNFTVNVSNDLYEKIDGLAPGSLMKIAYNSDGYLTAAEVVFKNAVLPEPFNNAISNYYQYFCGDIQDIDTETGYVSVNAVNKKYVMKMSILICVDSKDLTARVISAGDLHKGERMYVYRAAGGGRICAIVR